MSDQISDEKSMPQAFLDAVKQRLAHPVAGVFALAWILFNWRFLFFLLVSQSPAESRINAALIYSDCWKGIAYPLAATIAYLGISPWLTVGVARWNARASKKQSLLAYQDALVELQRRTELEQLALQSSEPAVRSQQEAKVRLERELKTLNEQRAAAQHEIRMLAELSSAEWESVMGRILFEKEELSSDKERTQKLSVLKQKFETVSKLAKRLTAEFPELKLE